MRRRHVRLLFATPVLIAACGGGSDTTEPTDRGIRIVAGAGVSDTVLAKPLQALIVEVRSEAKPASGVVVRLESVPSTDSTRRFEPTVTVSKLESPYFSGFFSDTTNASGRVSVVVQLGTVAGRVRLAVSAPELGVTDTATFTVLPGTVSRVSLSPRDTTIASGGSYVIGGYATDRFGNRRDDPVTFAVGPNVRSVDATGRVTVGTAVGRGAVAVRAGAALDSARFTVAPDGTMAFLIYSGSGMIATSRLDGSALKTLVAAASPAYPNLSPAGDLVAYQQSEADGVVIYVVDRNGIKKPLVDRAVMRVAASPHFSGDGQFVYFYGNAVGDTSYAVWRVRKDGTALTRVFTPGDRFGAGTIGVAPDGSRIAYVEDYTVKLVELGTGTTVSKSRGGTFPEFSPDGTRLAYLAGNGILIARVDGTSVIGAAGGLVNNDAGLTWTADSKWLVVRGYFGPLLVNASTGEALTLHFPSYYQFSAR
ncbi:MAG: hypothetical protein ACJ79A_20835 [Gemmatimonadaceae bacterium]